MHFGIVEPEQSPVTGTVALLSEENGTATTALKRTKDGKIVLQPQPSDDPDDLLNWTILQRDLIFILMMLGNSLSATHGAILSSMTVALAENWGKSIGQISELSSYMLLIIGASTYIVSPICRTFGKRGLILFGLMVLVASDAWAANASTYNTFMGARCLSGVGQAVFEGSSGSIIADLFFVHERGKRVAFFVFTIATGITLGVPLGARVFSSGGVKWTFAGLAIAEGTLVILVALFFFEPSYSKPRPGDMVSTAHEDPNSSRQFDKELGPNISQVERTTENPHPATRKPYLERLSLYNGRFSSINLLVLFGRCVAITFHPTVLWCALEGLGLSWSVGVSYTISQILDAPPYNFSAIGVGNMFIAAWLGLLTGVLISATSDMLCQVLTKRNNNTYEPEFRLLYIIPGTLFSILGFAGWGYGVAVQIPWIGLAIFIYFMYAGVGVLNSAPIAYIIDAHKMYSIESQVVIMFMKNIFPFTMGYYFVDWEDRVGSKTVWVAMAAITAGVSCMGLIFYFYGKVLRAFWMRHPYLGFRNMN